MQPRRYFSGYSATAQRDGTARRLVVFDNVDDPDALMRYLPVAGTTKVLITTNRQEFTTMPGIIPVEVGMFTPAQGAEFLNRATGHDPAGDGIRLGEALGWLPLGLSQAAAYIVQNRISYAEYTVLVTRQDLDGALRRRADHPGVLQASRLSLAKLSTTRPGADAIRLLRVLSLLSPDGISRDLLVRAEHALALTASLPSALDALATASLVTLSGDLPVHGFGDNRRIVVHRLTALVVRHEAGLSGDDLTTAIRDAVRLLTILTDAFPYAQVALRRAELDELDAHLDAARSHTSDQSPLLLAQIARIARRLEHAGDLTRALPLHEQTLCELRKVLGYDHPDTLRSQNDLAGTYQSAGRLNEAIALYEQTLAGRRKVLGDKHPDTLQSQNDLAYAYASAERFDEAIALYEQTLTDRRKVLGDKHPDTLRSQNNMAYPYLQIGHHDKAIALYEQTLTDRREVIGDDHPDTLRSRHNLASAYVTAQRLDEAITLYKRAFSDRRQVIGDDHPDTLATRHNLASAYASAGHLDEAVILHEQTLNDRRRVLGNDHPNTLYSCNSLAGAYQSAGRLNEAIALYEQTLADRQRVFGDEHPDTLTSRRSLEAARRTKGDT